MEISEIDRFYGEEIFSLKHMLFEERTKKIKKILDESYGSFPMQYDSAKKISDNIILRVERGEYKEVDDYFLIENEEYIPNVGNIVFKVKWFCKKYGDTRVFGNAIKENGKTIVNLIIYAENIVYYNLSSTIAHEIMHCFQGTLLKLKGVNDKSKLLYPYLLLFYQNAPSNCCELFFYGLYECYSIETTANISSVSNYIEGIFDKKTNVTTRDIEKSLKRFDKYQNYVVIKDFFEKNGVESFSEDDKAYITNCLTAPVKNLENGQYEQIYSKNDFSTERFLELNIKNIVSVCDKTINKMHKNIINYIENGKN